MCQGSFRVDSWIFNFKQRDVNRTINFWGRTIILASLTRSAGLAGVSVSTVPAAYSSTIGNMVFDL
ncbi:hypothetical protein, partial [Acetobacter pasteurianus]|uniref:hypothetical protein n=1 Tax=Acetobacter pasteurianus TaxID=438 RepID=UPI001BE03484